MIRALYIIVGLASLIAGINSWLGFTEISQVTAACYAFSFGCLALGEGINGGRS